MAWTLYLLVGITVVTASAHKCKQTSNLNPDEDLRRQYDSQTQEPAGIPNAPMYDRMNTRSVIAPPAYLTNVPEQVQRSQLKIEGPTRRSGNGSKVLTWKPYVESRRGQNTDKIVFPGPTSEEFHLEIPEKCKKLGICEDIPNYPTELAKKVIADLSRNGLFQDDKLDLPDIPDITQRVGPQEENIELCNLQEKVVYPKAAVDSNGNWHLVLNQDNPPLQGFKVEICDKDPSPCSGIVTFQPGYEARCIQKFTYRKMTLLHNGTYLEKTLKIPSCCSCVAKISLS